MGVAACEVLTWRLNSDKTVQFKLHEVTLSTDRVFPSSCMLQQSIILMLALDTFSPVVRNEISAWAIDKIV